MKTPQSIITKIWSRPGWVKRIIAWLNFYSLNIAIAAVILSLIVFMAIAGYLNMISPETAAIKQAQKSYMEQVNKDQSTDIFKRALGRLR